MMEKLFLSLVVGLLTVGQLNAEELQEVNGTFKNDLLYGSGQSDLISGFEGNDFLIGQQGDDTYVFGEIFHHDTVVEDLWRRNSEGIRELSEDRNTLSFRFDKDHGVKFDTRGGDLVIIATSNHSVTVKDFFGFSLVNSRGTLPKLINPIDEIEFANDVRLSGRGLNRRLHEEFRGLVPDYLDFTAIDAPDERGNPADSLRRCDIEEIDLRNPIVLCREGYLRGNYPREVAVRLGGLSREIDVEAFNRQGEKSGTARGDDELFLEPNQVYELRLRSDQYWRELSLQVVITFYPVAP